MKRTLFMLVAGLILLPSSAHGQELPFVHYTPDNDRHPLPSAEVHQVYQDRLGYIWMAVYSSGLVRYDGTAMDLFTTDDGLKDLTFWDVLEDSLGRLWVGTNAGLVVTEKPLCAYTAGSSIRFVSTLSGVPLLTSGVRKNGVAVDHEGWLWAGTESQGIIRYRVDPPGLTETDTLRTAAPGLDNDAVRSLVVRRDGTVWVGLRGGDLLVFEKGATQGKRLSQAEGAPDESVVVLYESPAGALWGGTWAGELFKVDEGGATPAFPLVNRQLQSPVISILAAQDGAVWAASQGSGLLRIGADSTQPAAVYTRRNGLLSENLHHVMQDREGNLWFSQSGGVSKLRFNYAAFSNLTARSYVGEQPILPAPSVAAVVLGEGRTGACDLWAATSEAGIACIEADRQSVFLQESEGLLSNWVNALTLDADGRLWIGTANGINAFVLDPAVSLPTGGVAQGVEGWGRAARLASYTDEAVVAITRLRMPEDAPGGPSVESLWFPGFRSLYCLVSGTWFLFNEASGLPSTLFHAVAYDDRGYLWVGTRDHGLYRSTAPITRASLEAMTTAEVPINERGHRGPPGRAVKEPGFEPVWSTANGAPTNQIETLLWRKGAVWVGTPNGLLVLEGDSARAAAHLTTAQGLKADNVISMALSPRSETLWIGTNQGLAEIDPETRAVLRTVTMQDGLVDNEVWFYGSVTVDRAGTVYYGTAKGIAIYRPFLDRPNQVAPLLRLQDVAYTENASGQNEVVLEYAGISFANEKQVQYKTRLLGYDAAWSVPKQDTKLRYTNLPAYVFPKSYTFEMLAGNEDGRWAAVPLAYSFSVQPAWWLRWWALAGYFVVLAVGVFAVDRIQRARLIRRERQRAHLRETELRAEAAELKARALQAENERKQMALEKGRALEAAYRSVQAKNEQLEQSHTIVAAINAETSFSRLLHVILEEARVIRGVEKAKALVYDPRQEAFVFRASLGWDMQRLVALRLAPEEVEARYVRHAEEVAEDVFVAKGPAHEAGAERLASFDGVASLLVLRVRVKERVEGYLVFGNLSDRDAFDERDVDLLRGLREHIRSAFIKTRLLEDLHAKNEEISVQRTELQSALDHLKATQAQLVQAEKMASLGQLTAGIAHEIKNPLNFVNNFAELNVELVVELREALRKLAQSAGAGGEDLEALLDDILGNTEQVVKHGQRADRIVKGMMLHTRGGTGEREHADLNALVEEYINLAYHGVRATQPGFNVTLNRSYDPAVGRVLVVPQEIGRVLLNLLNNAFYAVYERQARANGQYVPTVTVHTRCTGTQVEIRVQDDGTGIPGAVRARIFEPFFTTKPSGEGTGLGLSLSYDIVTHGHGGTLTVESEEGQYTAFTLRLPRSASAAG